MWQGRSAAAARAMTAQGLSLREAAKLLGLSYQRVDQLLQGQAVDDADRAWVAVEVKSYPNTTGAPHREFEPEGRSDLLVVFSRHPGQTDWHRSSSALQEIRERVARAITEPDSARVEAG
ncbi:hypothetical protein Acsp01_25580 [Actinoplanes sp. NBRC 101535]|nr:hypothetical protein Acsp01_25580 [Actinoplanes sp. NBRC 101535]